MEKTEITVGAVVSVVDELSEVFVELSEELSEESSEDEVVLSVLAVLLSSDFAQEDIRITMLTIRTNQDNKLFTKFVYRKTPKILEGRS